MIRLDEISHVRWAVTDMKRAEQFYGEVLGLTLLDRSPDGNELIFGMKNGQHLLILHHTDTPHPRARFYHGPHVALEVDEEHYDRIVPKLTNVEVYWGPNSRKPPWYEDLPKTLYFFDPDYNRLQILAPGAH